MSGDRRIKGLKGRLKSLTTSFNLIKAFVDEYDETEDATEVPVRLESLNTIWSDLKSVQRELEAADEAGFEQHLKDRSTFETSYYKVKGFLLSVNKNPEPSPSPTTSQSRVQFPPSTSQVRLPDVKLPVFSGNIDAWLNFYDLFLSLVHASHDLSNIQKFYYLRSSLAGDALKLIQTVAISANNYQIAWNILVDHYQNSARLKQTYMDSLFEFQTLKRESATELRSLVERFEANVKVLKQLGEKTEFWDLILIRMLSTRLDPTTRRDWEEYGSSKGNVSFNDLTEFIQRRVTVLQTLGKSTEPQPQIQPKKQGQRIVASHGAAQINPRKCIMCAEHHPLYQCTVFSKLGSEEKEKEVRRNQLCRNCLRKGHQARDCSSTSTCKHCRGRHHTQLCSSGTPTTNNSKTADSSPNDNIHHPTKDQPTASLTATVDGPSSYASAGRGQKKVLLATAIVLMVDDNGIKYPARALLDSGSECCFVSESFAQLLKVARKKVNLPVAGIGQASTQVRYTLRSTLRSRVSDYYATLDFLVLPKLTVDLPSTSVETTAWEMPPGVQLADPSFHQSSRIDLILGAEIFFDLFKVSGRVQLGKTLPTLVNSVLGWVVTGLSANTQPRTPIVVNVATTLDLHQMMERFWSMEADDSTPNYSVEELACEEHFQRTVARTAEGRYIVKLPVKPEILPRLTDNRRTAERRLRMLEGRLSRNETLNQQYCDFMDEYSTLNHMRLVDDDEQPPNRCYYMPHHAVVREDSTTTKVRVVFDASSKTPKGPSLNDALMVGPTIQQDLRSIIMRSRIRPVMLIADVKMMYRQILVDSQDTPLQRIVWRESPEQPIQTFELQTVTYGTACAPFLATRVLQQLASDERVDFPEAADVLTNDFYVDDCFSGANSVEEAIALRNQLEQLLARGGFQLRKWASNEPAVLEDVLPENRALQSSVELDRDQCIKSLGLHWEPASDQLRYKIQLPVRTPDEPLTKRIALSHIAQLFDPLGLVGPVVITAKVFMQTLWTLKDPAGDPLGWDTELPPALVQQWQTYHSQLPVLNELRIDRCILHTNPTSVQLHIFSDSSERAYGACVYLRSTSASGPTKVSLLTAKSKVAPLKQQSIPRLELCGALLATELYEKVIASLQLTADVYFWVDSMTVLSWLQSSPSTWTTFVANRVSKIQLATQNCTWNHISGQQNPADLISRGITPEELLHNNLWWHGPEWLQCESINWPILQPMSGNDLDLLAETRKTPVHVLVAETEPSFVDQLVAKFSSYQRLLRVTAYCLRFLQNSRLKATDRPKNILLSAEELVTAETTLIRLVQQQTYSNDWSRLQKKQPVSVKSPIRWFAPFLSPENVIRIGGRLDKATAPYESKHQMLLPASHALSALLVRNYHNKNLHAAPQLLLSILRLRYWITGARNLAKRIVHTCVTCTKARPKLVEQFMAELPASRVTAARPFTVTGIDYWGPILLKPAYRKAAARKAYVAVYVCFATKAVHIELVADQTTQKFIQSLRRFVSRRGLCSDIHTDNGRNFVGAANELRRLLRSDEHQNAIADECTSNGIRWHFNPPKASHFGGLWEAAIASAQKHFVRALGTHQLAYDDLETILVQIECCLNSRPIVPLSDDPSDLEPLTPGHFLTGSALKAVPDTDVSTIPTNRLRHWQQIQKILQNVWKRWHSEYLAALQQRTKWCNPPVAIEPGRLVIIKDDNFPPMHWPTGRIEAIHPGNDGVTRVVTIRTADGLFTRPVAKICLLPIAPPPPADEITATASSKPAPEH